jgi:hypothetical protein
MTNSARKEHLLTTVSLFDRSRTKDQSETFLQFSRAWIGYASFHFCYGGSLQWASEWCLFGVSTFSFRLLDDFGRLEENRTYFGGLSWTLSVLRTQLVNCQLSFAQYVLDCVGLIERV